MFTIKYGRFGHGDPSFTGFGWVILFLFIPYRGWRSAGAYIIIVLRLTLSEI